MTMLDIPNIFSDVDSVFGQVADFSIANLETPLADTGTMHPTKSVAYRSEPTTVNALNNAGIDIVSLANNHTMDYMEPALLQTQDVLADHNILYCGAGMNSVEAYEPVLVSEKGMVLAFMGCSDRTGQYNNAQPYLQAGYNKAGFAYMTPYYLTEQINNVDEIADLKIVMMHGGSEYSTQPGSDYDKFIDLDEDEDFNPRIDIPHLWDIEIRHFAIDAGADLVIVHHPHKVQAIEVYNGKVIAHSLGNFVFDLNYPECFPSMILNGDAYADGFRYFTVTPVYLDHYKPKVVTGELGTHLLRDIAMKSRDLNTIINVRPDINRAEVILDTLSFNMEQELVQVFTVIDSVETGEFLSPPLAFNGIPSSINQLNAPDSTQFKLGRELFPFGNMEDEGIDYWDLNAQCSYDSLEFASGSRSLRIDWQNTEIDLERNLPLVGDDLSLVGKIKTRACTEAEIEINYYQTYNSTYSSTEETSQSLTGTNDWTDICLDLNPPAWAGYFRITLRMDGQTDSTAVWFDDLHLITWDTWQSEVPMQITYPNDYYWLRLKSVEASDDVQCIYGTTNITFYDPVSNQDASSLNGIHHVGNYPNPFNPTTTIEFSLSNPSSELNVSVYNIRGQKVKTIFKDRAEIGKHSIIWDGTDKHNRSCATGVYFYKISTSGESYSGKMLMLK
jgi:poly-gamma-glutamate synthesis protein (capsule biosynthesis protein)